MTENMTKALAWVGFGVGVMGIAAAAYSMDQANACKRMISDSQKRISELTNVDVDQYIVNEAVRKAVREQASEAVGHARRQIEKDMSADLRNRIKQAVGNKTEEINKQVADQLAKEMDAVDKDEIISQVMDATTDKLIDKLGDDLDHEVGKIGKIYKGIAAVLQ